MLFLTFPMMLLPARSSSIAFLVLMSFRNLWLRDGCCLILQMRDRAQRAQVTHQRSQSHSCNQEVHPHGQSTLTGHPCDFQGLPAPGEVGEKRGCIQTGSLWWGWSGVCRPKRVERTKGTVSIMRRKSAYILLMTAAERKLSQWSCRGAPSLWSLTPHFTDEGDLDRENGLKTGEKGAEISWLVSCKARPGAHCPDGGPRALSSEGGLVGSEQGGAGGNSAGRSPFS